MKFTSRCLALAAVGVMATGCGTAGDEAEPSLAPTVTANATSEPATTPTAGLPSEPVPTPITPEPDATLPGQETSTPVPQPDSSAPSSMPADGPASQVAQRARADVQARVKPTEPITVLRVQEAPLREDTLAWCGDRGVEMDEPMFHAVMQSGDRVWVYLAGSDAVPVLCATDEADGGTGFVPPPGLDD